MECWVFIIYILALLFIVKVIIIDGNQIEGLSSKPNSMQIKNMAKQVLDNQIIFKNEGFTILDARNRMKWMDVIVYEDLRELSKKNKMTDEYIINTIRG
jgi:hypothetical protein